MTHTFDTRQEVSRESLHVILQTLQAVTTDHHQVVTNHTATPGSAARTPIGVQEVSQSFRYRESTQTPQLISSWPIGGVCPCPTRVPAGPNAIPAPRTRGPLEVVVNNESQGYRFPTVFSQHRQPLVPSCDHTDCNPPPDVGFLSRRFTENGNWIRARAAAVASPRVKCGCRSP